MDTAVAKIYRYPVKGLSAQILAEVVLTPGEGLPDDRRFAITHGASTYDSSEPEWRPKRDFLQLAKNERLAALETDYDSSTGSLTIRRNGRQVARGQITNPTGRLLINQFVAAYMKGEAPGTPCLVEAPGVMFSDTREKYVSILNAGSVADIERVVNAPVDPVRFRANLLLEGFGALGRGKVDRPPDRNRRRGAGSGRADRPLRRDRGQPGHRDTRHQHSAGSSAGIFPPQLRRLRPRGPGRAGRNG